MKFFIYFCEIILKIIVMGGNALKNTHTVRKETCEYMKIAHEIFNKIGEHSTFEPYLVKCYRAKKTHGDVDILIKINKSDDSENILKLIKQIFAPNEYLKNGNVISFNYTDFQVDFILINEDKWNIAKHYFDFDCLSNVMGKTFHKFNLSYGWDGLHYKFRNLDGRGAVDILMTNDPKRIFEFGGYDYDRYLMGFNTLEDIFKFAINGKYFDVEMLQMENLKSLDKKRNRKRGSYHAFLKYLEDKGINTRYQFKEHKSAYIPDIDAFFPEVKLLDKLDELQKRDLMNREFAEKFNGNLIMGWVSRLAGKELGEAIHKFKTAMGDEYIDFVMNNDVDAIRERFLKIYHGRN